MLGLFPIGYLSAAIATAVVGVPMFFVGRRISGTLLGCAISPRLRQIKEVLTRLKSLKYGLGVAVVSRRCVAMRQFCESQIISNASRRRLARCLIGLPLKEIERDLVLETLASTDGNRTVSARLLGLSVRTLRNKIIEYSADGIEVPRAGSLARRCDAYVEASAASSKSIGGVRCVAHVERFFFNLEGKQNTDDREGLPFASELAAFRAAQKLATELASTRPDLHGNSWIVIKRTNGDDDYYIGI
jgi:hypothetical protein